MRNRKNKPEGLFGNRFLTRLAQAAAILVLIVPAYGFFVLSHFLANYGIHDDSLLKPQLFSAGFASLIVFLLAPGLAAFVTVWLSEGIRAELNRFLIFISFTAVAESYVLRWMYVPDPVAQVSDSWWLVISMLLTLLLTFYLFCTPRGRIFARRAAAKNTRLRKYSSKQFEHFRTFVNAPLVLLTLLSFYLLLRTDKLVFLLVFSICIFGLLSFAWLLSGGRKELRHASLIGSGIFYLCLMTLPAGAIYGNIDSAWGGGGDVHAEITLDEQAGLLAPCTWSVHLLAETDFAYYVAFDYKDQYTTAYMVPKRKVSGLRLLRRQEYSRKAEAPLVYDNLGSEPSNPTQVRAEAAICRALPAFPVSEP